MFLTELSVFSEETFNYQLYKLYRDNDTMQYLKVNAMRFLEECMYVAQPVQDSLVMIA